MERLKRLIFIALLLQFVFAPYRCAADIVMFVEDDIDDPRIRSELLREPHIAALTAEFSFFLFRLRQLERSEIEELSRVQQTAKAEKQWALPSFSPVALSLSGGRSLARGDRLFYVLHGFAGLDVQYSKQNSAEYALLYFKVDDRFVRIDRTKPDERIGWDLERFRKLEQLVNAVHPVNCETLLNWSSEKTVSTVLTGRLIALGQEIRPDALVIAQENFLQLPRGVLRDLSLFGRADARFRAARTIPANEILRLDDISLPTGTARDDVRWYQPHQEVNFPASCCGPAGSQRDPNERMDVYLRCRGESGAKEYARLILKDLVVLAVDKNRQSSAAGGADSLRVKALVPLDEAFIIEAARKLGFLEVRPVSAPRSSR